MDSIESEKSLGFCVSRLKVLADPTRFSVLKLLMGSPKTVMELNQSIRLEQSLLSHHLKILKNQGLVHSERKGKSVLYSVSADLKGSSSSDSLNLGCCKLDFSEDRGVN